MSEKEREDFVQKFLRIFFLFFREKRKRERDRERERESGVGREKGFFLVKNLCDRFLFVFFFFFVCLSE